MNTQMAESSGKKLQKIKEFYNINIKKWIGLCCDSNILSLGSRFFWVHFQRSYSWILIARLL
jgi:hypothetical protein